MNHFFIGLLITSVALNISVFVHYMRVVKAYLAQQEHVKQMEEQFAGLLEEIGEFDKGNERLSHQLGEAMTQLNTLNKQL